MKLLIIGHGRHGKDTVAELLAETIGLKFESSSLAAARIFLYDMLKEKYGYKTFDECYNDRSNHRQEWYEAILAYNTPDKIRLAKEILKDSDCYVGMREITEIQACRALGIIDLVIWVDASERCPLEPANSFNITKDLADIIIENNGTYEELKHKIINFSKIFSNGR